MPLRIELGTPGVSDIPYLCLLSYSGSHHIVSYCVVPDLVVFYYIMSTASCLTTSIVSYHTQNFFNKQRGNLNFFFKISNKFFQNLLRIPYSLIKINSKLFKIFLIFFRIQNYFLKFPTNFPKSSEKFLTTYQN